MRMNLRNFCAVATLGLSLAGCGYNTIPTAEENARAEWAVVQDAYKRRDDLIPDLVSAAQGCDRQAADVENVTKARARATEVRVDAWQLTDADELRQFQDAQARLTGALGALMASAAKCPDLKLRQNVAALQSRLDDSERRIAASRHDYDAAARDYNVALQSLPTMLWAATLFRGKTPMAAFAEADDATSARR